MTKKATNRQNAHGKTLFETGSVCVCRCASRSKQQQKHSSKRITRQTIPKICSLMCEICPQISFRFPPCLDFIQFIVPSRPFQIVALFHSLLSSSSILLIYFCSLPFEIFVCLFQFETISKLLLFAPFLLLGAGLWHLTASLTLSFLLFSCADFSFQLDMSYGISLSFSSSCRFLTFRNKFVFLALFHFCFGSPVCRVARHKSYDLSCVQHTVKESFLHSPSHIFIFYSYTTHRYTSSSCCLLRQMKCVSLTTTAQTSSNFEPCKK